jgi:predicted dehydrogenase
MTATAVVIGSGWAGEGHSIALQRAGVTVVALCGRTQGSVEALAARLQIPATRLDWAAALREFHPDIVSIATPAAPHREMAEAAAFLGCHVFCDKPLALSAADARSMLLAVEQAGVKHAGAASSGVSSAIERARAIVDSGAIGSLTGVDSDIPFGLSRPLVHSWFHELKLGGGMLNQIFTHALAQVLRVTGGTPVQVLGEAHCNIRRAPIGPAIHDFRDTFSIVPEVDETDPGRWRPADADTDYSAMVHLLMPAGKVVTARFHGSLASKSPDEEHLIFYGKNGTLAITGRAEKQLAMYHSGIDKWEHLPPSGADDVQSNWDELARRFVDDIQGKAYSFYPTFKDGWIAAQLIDAIRAGNSWTPISVN